MTRRQKCDICRSRKIKCDEAIPVCGQCRQGDRPCTYRAATSGNDFSDYKGSDATGIRLRSARRALNGTGAFITFTTKTTYQTESHCSRATPCHGATKGSYSQLGDIPHFDQAKSRQLLATTSKVTSLASPAACRQQLIMRYLDDELPARSNAAPTAFDHWFAPCGNAMQTAIDCSLLLQLARTTREERYLREARACYGRVIRQLGIAIQAPNAAWNDDILGATHALKIAGQHRELVPNAKHMLAHSDGLDTILRARGPSCLQSFLAFSITTENMSMSILKCLRKRQPHYFGEPEWQKVLLKVFPALQIPHVVSGLVLFVIWVACLPAILAEADRLCFGSRPADAADIQEVLKRISEWKAKATPWLSAWHRSRGYSAPLICKADGQVEKSEQDLISEYLSSLPVEYPFRAFYGFKDVAENIHHGYYWGALLEAESAGLDLMMLNPSDYPESVLQDTRDRCESLAENLCLMVPSMHKVRHTASRDITICLSIASAQKWYEKSGDSAKAQWCTAIIQATKKDSITFVAFL